MKDCLFCSIAGGDASKLVWHNEVAAAFYDLDPKAPVHVLVVPKRHVKNLDALDDEVLAGQMLMAVRAVVTELGLREANKVVIHGEQMDHLHFHVMSDERYVPPTKVA